MIDDGAVFLAAIKLSGKAKIRPRKLPRKAIANVSMLSIIISGSVEKSIGNQCDKKSTMFRKSLNLDKSNSVSFMLMYSKIANTKKVRRLLLLNHTINQPILILKLFSIIQKEKSFFGYKE